MSLESRLTALVAAIGADVKGILTSLSGKNQTLTVKDEGTTLVSGPSAINFTGSGVTATNSSGSITVDIPGGGGSGTTYTNIKTANYTANASEVVRVDSSGGAFTVTLPSTPTDGTRVEVFDVVGSCDAFPVLVAPSAGTTVEDDATGLSINVSGACVPLVYSQVTGDWKVADMLGSGFMAQTPVIDTISPFLLMGA